MKKEDLIPLSTPYLHMLLSACCQRVLSVFETSQPRVISNVCVWEAVASVMDRDIDALLPYLVQLDPIRQQCRESGATAASHAVEAISWAIRGLAKGQLEPHICAAACAGFCKASVVAAASEQAVLEEERWMRSLLNGLLASQKICQETIRKVASGL